MKSIKDQTNLRYDVIVAEFVNKWLQDALVGALHINQNVLILCLGYGADVKKRINKHIRGAFAIYGKGGSTYNINIVNRNRSCRGCGLMLHKNDRGGVRSPVQ